MLETEMAPGHHSDCAGGTGCPISMESEPEREILVSGSRWGQPVELSWRKARSQLRPEGRRVWVEGEEQHLWSEERICSRPDIRALRAVVGRRHRRTRGLSRPFGET